MSLTTSRGNAKVGQLCEAFGISRQAYYAARKAPANEEAEGPPRRRPERREPWVSDATLFEKIRQVVAEFPVWGVRKVWAYLRRLGTVVSRKRVWKRMHALGLTLPPISEREQPLCRGHVAIPVLPVMKRDPPRKRVASRFCGGSRLMTTRGVTFHDR